MMMRGSAYALRGAAVSRAQQQPRRAWALSSQCFFCRANNTKRFAASLPEAPSSILGHDVNIIGPDSPPIVLNKEGSKRLIDAASGGDASAQLFLGQCFYDGNGYIRKNMVEAKHWLRMAAEGGDAEAQYFVGRAYTEDKGFGIDVREAVLWYHKSAKQGNAEAQCSLGVMLLAGDGVNQNSKKAFKYFTKAAKQDSAEAQFRLGCCYFDGCGTDVPKNATKAAEWFALAAEQDHPIGQLRLGVHLLHGDGITKDEEKALELLKQASPKLADGFHPLVDKIKSAQKASAPKKEISE